MSIKLQYLNSNEIGVFAKLTNSYCLVADKNCKNYNIIDSELLSTPIIETTICGMNIIGRMTAGNKYGLLVPSSISEKEYRNLVENLPEEITIKKVDEKLSALGNVICCNDFVAIVHPDISTQVVEDIKDTLNVEVFRTTINNNVLVGSYCVVSNLGGIVHPEVGINELEEICNIFQIPIAPGTLNKGCDLIGSGCLINDTVGFVGNQTTTVEITLFDGVFKLNNSGYSRYK
jgi:translation initiation factor 6